MDKPTFRQHLDEATMALVEFTITLCYNDIAENFRYRITPNSRTVDKDDEHLTESEVVVLKNWNQHENQTWSNTNNQFYDSLHMPVCTEVGDQVNSRVIKSYPDSGYIVFWEDGRQGNYTTHLFAQKYDKNGNRLWAVNGVPISAGTNNQHYTYGTNSDLRNYSVAATDSAGGFYLCYADDSTSNYVWQRVMVQHIRSDGSAVFPGAGFIVFTSNTANWVVAPQLIADGNKGFFIGHSIGGGGYADVYVHCYKDNNGTMQYYGGGQTNQNAFDQQQTGQCGNYITAVTYGAYVSEYMIYSDMQKGCNVTMIMSQNRGGTERTYTGYNWLWRVKKKSTAPSGSSDPPKVYTKDSVVRFSTLRISYSTLIFGGGANPVYTYATSKVESNGYIQTSNEVYGAEHTKAAIIATDGNMNVVIMAVNERRYTGYNTVSDWFTHAFYRTQQKFDSIPYEFTVYPYYPNFTSGPPPGQNKLGSYSANGLIADTLLYEAGSSYYYDFNIASGGNKFFATSITQARNVVLQQLQVQRITPDSFAVQLNTASKKGIVIGKENNASSGYIFYNMPMVTVDNNGNGIFYINENGRSLRASPIGNGAELTWGAMGKALSYDGANTPVPYIALDPINGTGVASWHAAKNVSPGSGNNIYMRHLDSLNIAGYVPSYKIVKQLLNVYGASPAYPAVLVGSSKRYTTIEAYTGYRGYDNTSPVIEVLDNYNLGYVNTSLFENTGTIRTANGRPYLDRNYTITPDNNPTGSAVINVRLFFTQAEFDALKAADPSITSPGDLAVIKQPATGSAPASYIFLAGEQTVLPQSWAAVPGGYYIEIAVTGFSNFFILKNSNSLPITWLGIQAQLVSNADAKVTWQVADQQNVKDYVVQRSLNGNDYADFCTVGATNETQYYCIVPVTASVKNYYRVMERDNDGRKMYSKVALLQTGTEGAVMVYPNPVTDHLQLTNVQKYAYLQITDIAGKIIHVQKISGYVQTVNVNQLAPGTYIIRLNSNERIQSIKFIKN